MLISQKLEIQNSMEKLQTQLTAAKVELERVRTENSSIQEMLRAENSSLQDKLVGILAFLLSCLLKYLVCVR